MLKNEETHIQVLVNPKQFNFLRESRKRKIHLYGSAGSSKSWTIAQFLIFEKMLKEHDIRILVTRKTGPALSKSAWLLVQDLLRKYEIPFDRNVVDRLITIGSNEMYFVALDDPDKLKSFEKINHIWAEETTELTREDYIQLGLRCRGENLNGINQLYFSYNPVLKPFNKYLKKVTENPPSDVDVLHVTYHDNAFLDKEYIEEIELLKEQDLVYWQIYGLGKWAVLKNLIYTSFDIVPESEWDDSKSGIIGYGLDFGFNSPSALIELRIVDRPADKPEVFVRELLYERKLTNNQLVEKMKELIPENYRTRLIVADSAEPDRIEEINQAGFYCIPCSKGPQSVRMGIDKVKRYFIYIHGGSANLIEEISNYKWKEMPDSAPIDAPVEFNDHAMAAIRYFLEKIELNQPNIIIAGNIFES